uniref:Uncharacterized protein n=1 Tax=Anopheles coluzzii TaxID=1518534 RepID=A0A8W7P198_ANOCL
MHQQQPSPAVSASAPSATNVTALYAAGSSTILHVELGRASTGELVSASANGLCCSQQLCYCGHCYQGQAVPPQQQQATPTAPPPPPPPPPSSVYLYANGQIVQCVDGIEEDEESYWSSDIAELPVLVAPLLPYRRELVDEPLPTLLPPPPSSSSYPAGTCAGPLFSVYLSPITPTTSTTAISTTITASDATGSTGGPEVLARGGHYCTNSRTIITTTANTAHPAKAECGAKGMHVPSVPNESARAPGTPNRGALGRKSSNKIITIQRLVQG